MKNLVINTELIESLNPCKDRFNNWLEHYGTRSFTILEFLELEDDITAPDKIWVAVRVLPRDLVEVFAIDCAFAANASADATTAAAFATAATTAAAFAAAFAAAATSADATAAASAYTAAAFAAAAAAPTAAIAIERENQIDALIMLIEGWNEH